VALQGLFPSTLLALALVVFVVLVLMLFLPDVASAATPPPPADPAELRLEVHKKARELHVYQGREKTATHAIGLGFAPEGHKRREGDGKTPEGRYFVCVKNPQSQYYLSLGINYPNAEDGRKARERGQISESEAASIERAEQRGTCPPWNTDLGGEIFIHGRGSADDWTLGCVALDDPPMKALFDAVPIGTEVRILP
jgi:murein L,D-transpeptidase YafK